MLPELVPSVLLADAFMYSDSRRRNLLRCGVADAFM